jgi:hypothetical protein
MRRFSPPRRRPSGDSSSVCATSDEVALAKPLDHPVEGVRQQPHLVARAYRQRRLREIAAGHAGDAAGEGADRPGQPPREEQPQRQRAQRSRGRALGDRDVQLAQPIEKDVDLVVDAEECRGAPPRVDDGRHRADPRATRGAIGARVARHAVDEPGGERLVQLGRHRVLPTGPLHLVGGEHHAGSPLRGVVVGERADGRRQQDLALHRGQRGAQPPIGRRLGPRCPRQLGVLRRIDEEHGDARDIEQLGADRILQLALLPLAHEHAHDRYADERQQRERHGQAHGQPPPHRQRWPSVGSRGDRSRRSPRPLRHCAPCPDSDGSRPTRRSSDQAPPPRVSRKRRMEAHVRCSAYAFG